MADTAFQTQYRQEFIAAFEVHQSLVRDTVTTETMIKGNTATFLVAGSGAATAVTRGVNGLIPARADDLTQTSATLLEWHDLVRKILARISFARLEQQLFARSLVDLGYEMPVVRQKHSLPWLCSWQAPAAWRRL